MRKPTFLPKFDSSNLSLWKFKCKANVTLDSMTGSN